MDDLDKLASELLRIDKYVRQFDESVRREAFIVLSKVLESGTPREPRLEQHHIAPGRDDFFSSRTQGKPADNAHLVAAFLYGQHGTDFSLSDLREVASDVGVTIPERVDVTLGGAQRDGRPLYRPLGRGRFRVTVHGENFLRTTFGVTRGRAQAQSNPA